MYTSILRRFFLADDLPTPGKGVYLYFEFIALGFVLVAVEEFMRGSSWHLWASALVFAAAFLFVGVMGPRMKAELVERFARLRGSKALSQEIQNLRDKIKLLELRDPEIAKQQAIEMHR